jgi:Spy/CpxP family protein refolding chaperone
MAIAISMAFSPWTRATLTVLFKVPLAFIAEYTGLRAVWRENIIDHVTLERKGQQQLEYIYKRQDRLKEERKRKEKEQKRKKDAANRATWGPDQNMARNLVASFHNGGGDNMTSSEKIV